MRQIFDNVDKRSFGNKISPVSKCDEKYEIFSILFVFYLGVYSTTVKITRLFMKQHIKYIARFSRREQNVSKCF